MWGCFVDTTKNSELQTAKWNKNINFLHDIIYEQSLIKPKTMTKSALNNQKHFIKVNSIAY